MRHFTTGTRESYIPKGAIKITPKDVQAEIYLYESGGPSAVGFGGKRTKPDFHIRFKTPERREQYVREYLDGRRKSAQMKAEWKAARVMPPDSVKVGDIFHYSWGYEQTQCEFYEVTEVRGQTCTIREIASRTEPGSEISHGMADRRVAEPGRFVGEPMKKRIQGYDGKPYLRMDHGGATPWDGRPMYCSWYG